MKKTKNRLAPKLAPLQSEALRKITGGGNRDEFPGRRQGGGTHQRALGQALVHPS